MSIKAAARAVLPELAADRLSEAARVLRQEMWRRQGSRPWARGYEDAKSALIHHALVDVDLQRRLREGGLLPPEYGVSIDERCVEIPWALAMLGDPVERLLDAGSALNHEPVLPRFAERADHTHVVTLAPEPVCMHTLGVSYLYEDLRALPMRSETYDAIVCISTLEHVGFDNTVYGADDSLEGELELAVAELARVLQPGGVLLLTVPFGEPQRFAGFGQLDSARLDEAIHAFGPRASEDRRFYAYTSRGWQLSDEAACAGARYVESVGTDHGGAPQVDEADGAAAARAIACVRLVKAG